MARCEGCGCPLPVEGEKAAGNWCETCQTLRGIVRTVSEAELEVYRAFDVRERRVGRRCSLTQATRRADELKPGLIDALLEEPREEPGQE
jgi:hypothetical protein